MLQWTQWLFSVLTVTIQIILTCSSNHDFDNHSHFYNALPSQSISDVLLVHALIRNNSISELKIALHTSKT